MSDFNCDAADDEGVIQALGYRLSRTEPVPMSAAERDRRLDAHTRRARKIAPHVLAYLRDAAEADDWLSVERRQELAWGAKRAAQRGVGLIQSWLLAAVIELIVRWLIEWYFSPASRAWRER